MKEQLQAILDNVTRISSLVRPDTAEEQAAKETIVLLNQAIEAAGAAEAAPAPTPTAPVSDSKPEWLADLLGRFDQLDGKVADLAHVVMAPQPTTTTDTGSADSGTTTGTEQAA